MSRRLVSIGALGLAAAALIWALILAFYSGFDFNVGGLRITTNEPLRPLILAGLALLVFTLTNGVERTHALWMAQAGRVRDGVVAAVLTAGVVYAGIAHNTAVASGPDQYGYVSQADLWLTGELHVPQPWAEHVPWPTKRWSFAPLGYRPIEVDGRWENVPTYSPGLPLLMAAAKRAGGQEAMFLLVPLFGGIAVLGTWGIGRRLGHSRAGLIAAWLVATSPAFLLHLTVPMSDVATAGAWTAAVYVLIGRPTVAAAASAGAIVGLALLIRPNLFILAAIAGGYVLFRRMPPEAGAGQRVARAVAFGLPVAAACVTIGAIYQWLYGSPFISGYGRFSDQFAWAHILPNLYNYFSWLVETQTVVALAGMAVVCVPIRRLWPDVEDRRVFGMIALMVLTVWALYIAYLVFDNLRYLRFLLLTWPFIMLGVGTIAVALMRPNRPGLTLSTIAAVITLGIAGWRHGAREGAFNAWESDRRFIALADIVRERTPPNSAVLAMIHSGSLRYYGGRMTIRYDILDPDWLDRGVAWLTERGVHVYLLLEEWEMKPFADRFAGQELAARIKSAPIVEYRHHEKVRLFDLSSPPPDHASVTPFVATRPYLETLRSRVPAPAPTLVFSR